MGNINTESVENYIRKLSSEDKETMDMRKYAEDHSVPIIEPEVRDLLKVILKMKKPKTILEIGTAIGYSSIVMSTYTPEDTKIYTIERNEKMYSLAKENIKAKGFQEKIEIIEGDALEVLEEKLESIGNIDLLFIDGAKSKYEDILTLVSKRLLKDSVIIADNVLFKGMITDDSLVVRRKKTIVRKMRTYLEYVMSDESLVTSIVPIGDGVAISYKL